MALLNERTVLSVVFPPHLLSVNTQVFPLSKVYLSAHCKQHFSLQPLPDSHLRLQLRHIPTSLHSAIRVILLLLLCPI
jgi:hypothetical protein